MRTILGYIFFLVYSSLCLANNAQLTLTSPEFKANGNIPAKYSYHQKNISPPIAWQNAPKATKSFVLIMIDYDAKKNKGKSIVHWLVYNIPQNVTKLKEGDKRFANGLNTYSKSQYVGMNPPKGESHKYHFYIYALNIDRLNFLKAPTAEELLDKVKNNLLGFGELVGNFEQ